MARRWIAAISGLNVILKLNDHGFAISEKPVLRYDLAAGVILRIAHKD
jgi:hypothetical protein